MRYKTTAILIITTIAVLTACSDTEDKTISESSDTLIPNYSDIETTSSEITEPVQTTIETIADETNPTENTIPEAYIELLDDYCNAVSNGEDRSVTYIYQTTDIYTFSDTENLGIGICGQPAGYDPLNDCGFAIIDFDNNGTDELIISSVPSSRNTYDTISAMYSLDSNGNAVKLLVSWDRNARCLGENGYIISYGTGGASTQYVWRYKIEGTSVICEGRLSEILDDLGTGETVYFIHPDDEIWPTYDPSGQFLDLNDPYIVSEETANEWLEEIQPLSDIEYTSFADYWESQN